MGAEQGRWVPAEDGGAARACSSSSLTCMATSRIWLMSLHLLEFPLCQVNKCPLDVCPEYLCRGSVAASPAAVGSPLGQSPVAVYAILP